MQNQKCIWMECGYIELRLCDRNFDCENCPFDKAIKKEIEFKKNDDNKIKNTINLDRVITPNHIWFFENDNVFTFGLDDYVQKFFNRNYSISFPLVGSQLFEGKTFLWIICSFGAIGFHSPISGAVIWINQEVKDNSAKFLEKNPFEIELIKVASNQKLSMKKLYAIENRDELNRIDDELIRDFLLKKFSLSKVYSTLPDGGELIKSYLNQLSNQEYLQLLKMLFNKKYKDK